MIVARERMVAALAVVSLSSTIAAAIIAYGIGMSAGHKAAAEELLFFGLAAALFELLFLGLLLRESGRRRRDLDTLAALVRNGGSVTANRLDKFGPLGERIQSILKELSDASDRKSARVASLTTLLHAVLELVDRPVLVIRLDGRIVAASAGCREGGRFKDKLPDARLFSDLVPELDLRIVAQEADRVHAPVERPGPCLFVPVFSAEGNISHFLVDFSRMSAAEWIAALTKEGLGKLGRDTSLAKGEAISETAGANSGGKGLAGFVKKRLLRR